MLVALPYAQRSWSIFESSPQPSGLPFVYLLKTLIPLFAVLVGLQGLAQAIRAARLSGSPRQPPPLGPTLFYLRGVAPPEVTTRDIYIGIIPFVLIQLAMLIALWFAPALATWLPHRLYG
jgi:TRAP-type mannitol/chloroaromatic compound transport system permease large subunit